MVGVISTRGSPGRLELSQKLQTLEFRSAFLPGARVSADNSDIGRLRNLLERRELERRRDSVASAVSTKAETRGSGAAREKGKDVFWQAGIIIIWGGPCF